MNGLKAIKLDALKRRPVMISVAVVIVLLAVWYLGWMTPEASKLSTINQQEQTLTGRLQTVEAQLQTDKHDSALIAHDAKYLQSFAQAVPLTPEAGPLTTQLYNLSKKAGVSLSALTDDTVTPPIGGVASIPLTIALKGSHQNCLSFLADIYKLPRLITVNTLTPTPAAVASKTLPDILANDNIPYTMTIGATAYFFTSTG